MAENRKRGKTYVEAPAWDGLWASFERELTPNRSKLTVETYRRCGRDFVGYLRQEGKPVDPLKVTREDVLDFLTHLRERGLMPAGIRLHHAALRRFFRWLHDEGERPDTPMERVEAPTVDEPPPAILSADDLAALLKACQGNEFLDRRDAAIIRFLLDTGARRAELLGMAIEDVDLIAQKAEVMGKGSRRGSVFFGTRTARDLDRYLRVRSRHPKSGDPLHRDQDDEDRKKRVAFWIGAKGALGHDGLAQMLQRRAREAGIDPAKVHPHAFRHAFAHAMKAAGASDEDVMTLGRWRDPKIMRRYGQAAALDRARDTHRALSPGDRI